MPLQTFAAIGRHLARRWGVRTEQTLDQLCTGPSKRITAQLQTGAGGDQATLLCAILIELQAIRAEVVELRKSATEYEP